MLFNYAWSQKGHLASYTTVIFATSYLLHLLLLHIIITFTNTFSRLFLFIKTSTHIVVVVIGNLHGGLELSLYWYFLMFPSPSFMSLPMWPVPVYPPRQEYATRLHHTCCLSITSSLFPGSHGYCSGYMSWVRYSVTPQTTFGNFSLANGKVDPLHFRYAIPSHFLTHENVNYYSASRDNWCTVGGDGGCRVGEVRAGTTSPMPDHKGFKLQQLVNVQKFSTLSVKTNMLKF